MGLRATDCRSHQVRPSLTRRSGRRVDVHGGAPSRASARPFPSAAQLVAHARNYLIWDAQLVTHARSDRLGYLGTCAPPCPMSTVSSKSISTVSSKSISTFGARDLRLRPWEATDWASYWAIARSSCQPPRRASSSCTTARWNDSSHSRSLVHSHSS